MLSRTVFIIVAYRADARTWDEGEMANRSKGVDVRDKGGEGSEVGVSKRHVMGLTVTQCGRSLAFLIYYHLYIVGHRQTHGISILLLWADSRALNSHTGPDMVVHSIHSFVWSAVF